MIRRGQVCIASSRFRGGFVLNLFADCGNKWCLKMQKHAIQFLLVAFSFGAMADGFASPAKH